MRQFRFSIGTPQKPTRFIVEDAKGKDLEPGSKFVRCDNTERFKALLIRLNISAEIVAGRSNSGAVLTQNQVMVLMCRCLEDAFSSEPGQRPDSDRITNADMYGMGL